MTTYSLFIERPRTGADPVPYGPFLKTKLLAEAESWVAAPVLSAKAAANVREGDLFTARYPDTKLRDERGKLSRVVAFGLAVQMGRILTCTKDRAAEGLGIEWTDDWHRTTDGRSLMRWADRAPRQVIAVAACAIARAFGRTIIMSNEIDTSIAMTEAWAMGKATVEQVEEAGRDALQSANGGAAYHASRIVDGDVARHGVDVVRCRGNNSKGAAIIRKFITLPDAVFGAIIH